jgi:hypothetical protein
MENGPLASRSEKRTRKLRAGSFVTVRPLKEILGTLDEKGCLAALPFMPEMAGYCGRRFRILYRVEKTCLVGTSRMAVMEFTNDDVVFLEGLRCSGTEHGGCQRACLIFWKEAWLESAEPSGPAVRMDAAGDAVPADRLRTRQGQEGYFCQSTELFKATHELSRPEKIGKIFVDIRAGTYTIPKSVKLVLVPAFRKLLRRLHDPQPFGSHQKTPDESLELQSGDLVEVKGLKEIVATLDRHGKNRGLEFSPDMKAYCGKRFRVHSRMDRMILEKNGEIRDVRNTVILEGITCGCFYALGGCPRKEFQLWREIWLKRVSPDESRRQEDPAAHLLRT